MFVAGFIGSPKMNFMDLQVRDGAEPAMELGGARCPIPAWLPQVRPGGSIKIGVRPEHFDRDDAPDLKLTITVDVVENLGGTSFIYTGRTPKNELLVIERREGHQVRPGEICQVGFRFADARLFDGAGNRINDGFKARMTRQSDCASPKPGRLIDLGPGRLTIERAKGGHAQQG